MSAERGGTPGSNVPDSGAPDTTVPVPLRAACVVLGIEVLGLAGVGAFVLVSTLTGHPNSVGRALLGAVLAFAGAFALAAGARGLYRLSGAARTPVVVLQLLALPVAYTLAFQADRVAYGGPILVAALSVLYLLFTPPAREALDRDPPR